MVGRARPDRCRLAGCDRDLRPERGGPPPATIDREPENGAQVDRRRRGGCTPARPAIFPGHVRSTGRSRSPPPDGRRAAASGRPRSEHDVDQRRAAQQQEERQRHGQPPTGAGPQAGGSRRRAPQSGSIITIARPPLSLLPHGCRCLNATSPFCHRLTERNTGGAGRCSVFGSDIGIPNTDPLIQTAPPRTRLLGTHPGRPASHPCRPA